MLRNRKAVRQIAVKRELLHNQPAPYLHNLISIQCTSRTCSPCYQPCLATDINNNQSLLVSGINFLYLIVNVIAVSLFPDSPIPTIITSFTVDLPLSSSTTPSLRLNIQGHSSSLLPLPCARRRLRRAARLLPSYNGVRV